jgi:hypothetical protein
MDHDASSLTVLPSNDFFAPPVPLSQACSAHPNSPNASVDLSVKFALKQGRVPAYSMSILNLGRA